VPFVSKAIGAPLAKLAALVMVGKKLKDMGFTEEITPKHFSVKEAVFPFNRFPGIDVVLSPEMKSTGEVMGIDEIPGLAYLKAQVAAGSEIPAKGNVFVSVRELDKEDIIPIVKDLVKLGYAIYATPGTATSLCDAGVKTNALLKISRGRPNVLDMMKDEELALIINTPTPGPKPMVDEIRIRAEATLRGIPIITTVSGAKATADGLTVLAESKGMEICSLQEYHSNAIKLNL
jgi:carbamoyl-phosphate synthase large subunit